MLNVTHITTVHPITTNIKDNRIFDKQCKSLAQAGYKVSIITQADDDFVMEGIQIISIGKAKNRIHRMTVLAFRALQKALSNKANIYHFHDPELIPIGLILRLCGKTVIYDVHEDLPNDIRYTKPYLNYPSRIFLSKLMFIIEWFAGKILSAIVTASPAIGAKFPTHKTVVLHNYSRLDEFSYEPKNDNFSTYNDLNIIYAGGINEIRCIKETITALSLVPATYNPQFYLAGNFSSDQLYDEVTKQSGWEFTNYLGYLNRANLLPYFKIANMGIVIAQTLKTSVVAQPIKLFEYMAAGIPVIAADFPLWREFVTNNECGLLVESTNPQSIADAISWLHENPREAMQMGINGRKAVETTYNWENEAKKMFTLYDRLLYVG